MRISRKKRLSLGSRDLLPLAVAALLAGGACEARDKCQTARTSCPDNEPNCVNPVPDLPSYCPRSDATNSGGSSSGGPSLGGGVTGGGSVLGPDDAASTAGNEGVNLGGSASGTAGGGGTTATGGGLGEGGGPGGGGESAGGADGTGGAADGGDGGAGGEAGGGSD